MEPRRHLEAVPGGGDLGHSPAPDLLDGVRQALRSDSPVELIGLVSGMLEVSDSRDQDVWGDDLWGDADREVVPRVDLVRSFLEIPYAETTALLTVMSRMLPADDALLVEIGAELSRRRHPLPLWLRDLAEGRVETSVARMTETLGDGENCMLGLRFASGAQFTAVIYIDHNLGSAVKDAFLIPEPLHRIIGDMRAGAFGDSSQTRFADWDPATARATVSAALEQGRRTLGMPESDHWPMLRPSIEWLLTLLPAGGVAEGDEPWDDAQVEALRAEFLAYAGDQVIDDEDAEFGLDMILHFGSTYNVGGPLRWSESVAERFLLDWMPRKVMVGYEEVEELPTLLATYVAFVHRREGVDAAETAAVLTAIADAVDPFALAMSGGDPMAGIDPFDLEWLVRAELEEAVGGYEALDALDAEPLPDEDFAWGGIAEDIRERVGEFLELLDRVAGERLDVEHRTAMRRFLARVAIEDPAIFRRRASVPRGAAAIGWAIGRANDTVGAHSKGVNAKEFTGWFGVDGSVSERAQPMLRAIGAPPPTPWGALALGAADLLVSDRRAAIIEERDRLG